MRNFYAILCATLIVLLNGRIEYISAPYGIFLTPIVLAIASLLICFGTVRINIAGVSLLISGLVILNDILIKVYGGGIHDYEGMGIVNLFFLIGLVPTTIILIVSVFRQKGMTLGIRLLSLTLFCMLIIVYFHFFYDLGLDLTYHINR